VREGDGGRLLWEVVGCQDLPVFGMCAPSSVAPSTSWHHSLYHVCTHCTTSTYSMPHPAVSLFNSTLTPIAQPVCTP
jgi:hypothetical protein